MFSGIHKTILALANTNKTTIQTVRLEDRELPMGETRANIGEISGSHGDEYEALGCCVVQSG
jgi:hypothetical protein